MKIISPIIVFGLFATGTTFCSEDFTGRIEDNAEDYRIVSEAQFKVIATVVRLLHSNQAQSLKGVDTQNVDDLLAPFSEPWQLRMLALNLDKIDRRLDWDQKSLFQPITDVKFSAIHRLALMPTHEAAQELDYLKDTLKLDRNGTMTFLSLLRKNELHRKEKE